MAEDHVKPEHAGGPAHGDVLKPEERERWFATFTILDVSGAMDSSQLRRLRAAIATLWRLTWRRVSDRSKSLVVGV